MPPKCLSASKQLFTEGGKCISCPPADPRRTVHPLVLMDVGFVGTSDREEMGKGWDRKGRCMNSLCRSKADRGRRKAQAKQLSRAVSSLYISQIPLSSTSLLQPAPKVAPGLPDQAQTLGVSRLWGSSYTVAVSWTPYKGHPVLTLLNLASDKLLCLPSFFSPRHSPGLGPIHFDRTLVGILPN